MWLTVQLRIAIYKISYRDDDRLFVLVLTNTGNNSKKVETESKFKEVHAFVVRCTYALKKGVVNSK